MRRAGERRKKLKEDASAAVVIASLSDLFGLERHAGVPTSLRGEQLQRLVLHYITYLSEWYKGELPEPPFVRLGRFVELPAVDEVKEAEAEEGSPVQSRRHDGDTPSVRCTPAAPALPSRLPLHRRPVCIRVVPPPPSPSCPFTAAPSA